MSLYGDLPPPGSKAEADAKLKKDNEGASASATIIKPPLPAGWSSSVTRLKPMLNRKLAPPKAKPIQRSIPAGFVAHTGPTASVTSVTVNANNSSAQGQGVPTQAPAPTVDESSWLKARTAQVQRKDLEVNAHIKKQGKIAPKGQQGLMSLDDDYDIERPNEYEEFRMLFENERREREEERRRQREQDRDGYSSSRYSHSRSRSMSRSRSRSRSRSYSRSRSRSMSRSRSRSRSRSPIARSHTRSSFSRNYSRSPSSSRGTRSQYRHSRSRSRSRGGARDRSISPSAKKSHARSRSRSPPPSFARRRSPSPRRSSTGFSRQQGSPPRRDPSPARGRPTAYKAFAPPPSHTSNAPSMRPQDRPVEGPNAGPTPAPSPRAPMIMNDNSGEDAFLRRAQMSQQRGAAPTQHHSPASAQHQQQHRVAFVQKTPVTASKGTPSNVILLTNMVGPGEVDDTLQEETAAECEKFGPVVRCLIFEVQNGRVPPDEAVRIFVKFGNGVSAERALRDLDGRFFGGRQVRGQYYDERKFDALQLAP